MKTTQYPKLKRIGKKPQDRAVREHMRVDRLMDNLSSASTIVTRKLALVTTLSTNGSGFIAATQYTSDSARTAADFTSFGSRYSQFRVKALRIRLVPLVDMTTAVTVGGGVVTPHPTALGFAKYLEGSGYSTFAAIMTGSNSKLFNGNERIIEYEADWTNVPEAKLWTSTGGAIPTACLFGVQFQDTGVAPAAAASTVYYRLIADFVVQFCTPQ